MAIILIIEDNPITGWGLAEDLRRIGHRAEWAVNGASALAKAAVMRPDAVILDIVLPDIDGRELLRCLDGVARRVLVLTALPDLELDALRSEFPTAEIVRKPVEPAELMRLLGPGDGGLVVRGRE